jgi:hypothetical protein
MKISESRITFGFGTAAILFVLLAGLGGNLKGKADASAAREAGDHPTSSPDAAAAEDSERTPSGSQDPRRLEKIRGKLLETWKPPTICVFDPEARAQTSQLLSQMSSAEIDSFLRSLPPGSDRKGATSQMVRCVLFSWVLQDGPPALAYLGNCDSARSNLVRMRTTQMVMSWADYDPDAALAWMGEGTLTPVQKNQVANIHLNSLMVMLDSDPDRAFAELSSMQGKEISDQLRLWGGTNGKSPEMRERLLDYAAGTGNPEDLAVVRTSIAGSMAEVDPDAARAFVGSLQASDEELAALDASVTVATARKNPESAYTDWLQRNSKFTEVPAAIQLGISAWLGQSSMGDHDDRGAIKWLDALPAGTQRDALYESSIPALVGFRHFDEAARMAETIDSPSLRASTLNALQTRWLLVDSQRAAVWKEGLPPEDQMVLRK